MKLKVLDKGRQFDFTFDEIEKYHGPIAPAGIAHAFKVMERAFAILSPNIPPERSEIKIETCFRGPGGRDAFEMVTRAVTKDRFTINLDLGKPYEEFGNRSRYVFKVFYGDKSVTLMVKEGIVSDEFLALGAKENRTADEEIHRSWFKLEMTDRIMKLHSSAVYDVVEK